MRLVTSGLVIALLVFTVQQSTGQEVLISEPEINDTTVTVSGYVVPERPGGVEAAKRSGVLVEGMGEKGLVGLLAWEVAFIVIVFLFPIVFKDGTVTWESRVSTHWTTEDELEVDLPQPWASGSAMVVIDRHAGTWAAVHEPLTKSEGLPEAPFQLEGFHEGSESIVITGLEPGAELYATYVTPGARTTQSFMMDGSFGDLDGEANGVIESVIPRYDGLPHALSGEILTLSARGEGEGGIGVWTCTGDGARLVVPVASHIIGASGQPFISDLDLSNPFGVPASGWVRYIPEGSSWNGGTQVPITLEPFETATWGDVLQTGLDITADTKGTLVVGGTPGWTLSASSRNYTVDDSERRFGIAISGVRTLAPMTTGNLWIIPGMRHTDDVRANLVLAGAVPQTSVVTVRLMVDGAVAAETEYEVPGFGLKQVNRLAEKLGVGTVEKGHLELEVTSGAVVGGVSLVDSSADDAAFVSPQALMP